jgi:hypothetical protein
MKKTLLILGLMLLPAMLFGADGDLSGAFNTQITNNLTWVWTLSKLFGFAVVIWGITDLITENQQQQGQGGSKYMKALMKIIVGGVLIAADSMYNTATGAKA